MLPLTTMTIAKPSPKIQIASKDAAVDIPRTLNEDDIAKDLLVTEVDKDNSLAGALTNNNVTGKAVTADISNPTPSKEDFVLDPSIIAPNTANMPPSINISSANNAITNLPAIAFLSTFFSITLKNY